MRYLLFASIALAALVHSPRAQGQSAASGPPAPSASWLPMLHVAVRNGAIDAPDSARSGWTRFHIEKDGGHIVVAFRLRADVPAAEVSAFVAALDTARATPRNALALSGLEVMQSGELVLDLAPGRYLLACMRRGADGKRHVHAGESKELVVASARARTRSAGKPPEASSEVHMLDFAYRSADRWRRGPRWVRVSNEGAEDHLVLVARLHDGVSLSEWATETKEPKEVATPVTGAARMGPGAVAYLPVSLTPGRYVLYCLIPNAKSGAPHMALGMFKEITVE